MKVYGDLEAAQLEVIAADPAVGTQKGRVFVNDTDSFAKYNNGTAQKRIIDDGSHGYFGTPNVDGTWPDGTWRISVSAGLLVFEKKVTGTWTKLGEMG